jgi:uncharacterized membrane protein
MGWGEYVAAFAAFFLTHAIPIRPPVRPWLQARLGRAGFGLAYSALSLGVLAWLIGAAGRAPYVPVWHWAPWQNHVPLAVMLPVFLILALAVARPNPFSFGGARNDRFDPDRPGIVALTRHPLLLALVLWAAVHVVPNGDLAHVILFGTFAAFALLGGRLVDRRKRRESEVISILRGNISRPPNCSVRMPRKMRLTEPIRIGVATSRPNWLSLRPSSVLMRGPMIEEIVHTAKQTVKAKVERTRALHCSLRVTPSSRATTSIYDHRFRGFSGSSGPKPRNGRQVPIGVAVARFHRKPPIASPVPAA